MPELQELIKDNAENKQRVGKELNDLTASVHERLKAEAGEDGVIDYTAQLSGEEQEKREKLLASYDDLEIDYLSLIHI